MKHIQQLRLIMGAIMLTMTLNATAQTNGDKLFMEGQQLQQTQTVAAQNQAIKKFQTAKVVYTTTEKKKMCDNQIAICRNNIASLKRSSRITQKTQEQTTVASEKEIRLSLSTQRVEFDGEKAGTATVTVTAPTTEWTFNILEGTNGEENFAHISRKSDAKGIDIEVGSNPRTISRRQTISVTQDENCDTLTIVQRGKNVTLSANSSLLEYGLKGGSKSIELYTNSDSIITSNNNQAWWVESKPEWVETSVEVKKSKSVFGKGISKLKGLVSGTATAAESEDSNTANVKIVALPMAKSDPDYESGRKGEIVFASQEQRYKVIVLQHK